MYMCTMHCRYKEVALTTFYTSQNLKVCISFNWIKLTFKVHSQKLFIEIYNLKICELHVHVHVYVGMTNGSVYIIYMHDSAGTCIHVLYMIIMLLVTCIPLDLQCPEYPIGKQ